MTQEIRLFFVFTSIEMKKMLNSSYVGISVSSTPVCIQGASDGVLSSEPVHLASTHLYSTAK